MQGSTSKRIGTWLLVLTTLAVGSACKTAAIYEAKDRTLPRTGDLELVKKDIERAGHMLGWTFEETAPGSLVGVKTTGKHSASVTLKYDERSFSITYRNSHNLRYSGGEIHKTYNVWVKALEDSIKREVASR